MSKWTYSPDPFGNAIFDEEGRWIGEPADDEIGRLFCAAPELLAMLKRLEWVVSREYGPMCEICGNDQKEGHRDDCELKMLLDEVGRDARHTEP